jgi:hypothetical protein
MFVWKSDIQTEINMTNAAIEFIRSMDLDELDTQARDTALREIQDATPLIHHSKHSSDGLRWLTGGGLASGLREEAFEKLVFRLNTDLDTMSKSIREGSALETESLEMGSFTVSAGSLLPSVRTTRVNSFPQSLEQLRGDG